MKDLIEKIVGYLPQYLSELGRLLVRPKSFLRQRNQVGVASIPPALVFLGVSLSITVIMRAANLPPKIDLWTFIGVQASILTLLTALMAADLRIAWRLVGGKAPFRAYFVTYAYVASIALILSTIVGLASDGIIKLLDPPLYQRLRAAQASGGAFPPQEFLNSVAWPTFLVTISVLFVFSTIWSIATWGAYRELNGLGRLRSFGALFIGGVLAWPILLLVVTMQKGMLP